MDIILFTRLYSSRVKVCRTLDPTACSKMLSEKACLRKKKNPRLPFTYSHPIYTRIQEFACQVTRMLSPCWGIHNSATIWCWMSSQVFKFDLKLTFLQSSSRASSNELALISSRVNCEPGLYCMLTYWLTWWLLYYCCHFSIFIRILSSCM